MKQQGSIMQTSTDDLSERVTISVPAELRDDEGNIYDGQPSQISSWAKVLPYGSRISDGHAEQVNEIDYRVIIRYRPNITIPVGAKIFWRGKILEMLAPPYDAEGRHIWIVMECREMVEDAGES